MQKDQKKSTPTFKRHLHLWYLRLIKFPYMLFLMTAGFIIEYIIAFPFFVMWAGERIFQPKNKKS